MKDVVTQFEEEKLGMKSCIGFTPINEDWMMLQVWTEGKSKKYHTVEEVIEDKKALMMTNEPKPSQYGLYIPCGVMFVLPGDTVHAGGFCFSSKVPHPSKVPGKEILLQNGHFHFHLCCSQLAHDDCNGEASITVVSDNEPPYLRDYAPGKIIMESLFNSVLDCHADFVPIATYKKQTRGAKKKENLV